MQNVFVELNCMKVWQGELRGGLATPSTREFRTFRGRRGARSLDTSGPWGSRQTLTLNPPIAEGEITNFKNAKWLLNIKDTLFWQFNEYPGKRKYSSVLVWHSKKIYSWIKAYGFINEIHSKMWNTMVQNTKLLFISYYSYRAKHVKPQWEKIEKYQRENAWAVS